MKLAKRWQKEWNNKNEKRSWGVEHDKANREDTITNFWTFEPLSKVLDLPTSELSNFQT